ncbi:hypothetical protein [Candidatus Clavichlamydia salmonicola]|uniref:hypothetical protein n=1 Tax=Candidatus Clavichlamydia salmonicola TaxID=469812 RepID=UPI0018913497|nr:hypothetical protein [Candidatus Clavichlamydia salmonicola]
MSIATVGSTLPNNGVSIYQDKKFISSKALQLIISIATMVLGILLLVCSILLLASVSTPLAISCSTLMILSGVVLGSIGLAIVLKKCLFLQENLVEKNQFLERLLIQEQVNNQHLKASLDTFSEAYHDLANRGSINYMPYGAKKSKSLWKGLVKKFKKITPPFNKTKFKPNIIDARLTDFNKPASHLEGQVSHLHKTLATQEVTIQTLQEEAQKDKEYQKGLEILINHLKKPLL